MLRALTTCGGRTPRWRDPRGDTPTASGDLPARRLKPWAPLVVVLLSVTTAVWAAGVPGGSLPLIMVVLATVGVRPKESRSSWEVDRILDMCRTTLNVSGDLTAAVYVDRSEKRLATLAEATGT
ncbi:MAG: cation:dicarboxylate symporter family transporter [Gemmatimonadales bacterium]